MNNSPEVVNRVRGDYATHLQAYDELTVILTKQEVGDILEQVFGFTEHSVTSIEKNCDKLSFKIRRK